MTTSICSRRVRRSGSCPSPPYPGALSATCSAAGAMVTQRIRSVRLEVRDHGEDTAVVVPFRVHAGDGDRAGRVDQAGGVGDDLVGSFPVGVGAVVGLEPDRVDDLVDAAEFLLADGQPGPGPVFADLLDRVGGAEVDRGGAERAGLGQSGVDAVDAVHLAGPASPGGVGGGQADGAGAEHGDGVAGVDVGQGGGVPAGDERVGEQHEVVLIGVAGFAGQADAVGVGPRYAQQLGLGAVVGAHTGGDGLDRAADLLDHTERLVAEHQPGTRSGAAVVQVQVGAADGAGGHADHRVGVGLDGRVRHVAYPDSADVLVHNGFHAFLPAPPSG